MNIDLDNATFIKLLKRNAEQHGNRKAALRQKSLGIWKPCSWMNYYETARDLALGLVSQGLVKEDKVAIIGSNRPSSLFAEVGAQAAGGITVSLYPDSTPGEAADILRRFDVKFVFAEDQEQVDKVLEMRESLPLLKLIVFCSPRGMRTYPRTGLMSLDELTLLGRDHASRHPGLFDELVERGNGDDIAIICTTSGTTGPPLGAMLSFRNLLSTALSLNGAEPRRQGDEYVSFLPLAWILEQVNSLASALSVGYAVNFPEKPETAMADLREIGPHIMVSPSSVWERIASTVQVKIMETTRFKRFMFRTFMPVGERVAALKLAKEPIPVGLSVMNFVAHVCLFRALKDRLGLSRLRSAASGGSALGPEVFRFFHAMGVNLKQLYGQTEVAGVSCLHRNGDVRGDTVGIPLPGTEIAIAPNGEILTRSNSVFRGYYREEAATARVLRDGWVHSGDAGELDAAGHLTVKGRLNEILSLADGTVLAAQVIEAKLKFSPYIREAIVIGSARTPLAALIAIDGRVVAKWAGDNKVTYTTYSDLAANPEIYALIHGEVEKANSGLPQAARLGSFALLYKELDPDDEELTRTGKVRRGVVQERFAPLIDALHAGSESIHIDTVIALQDGKSARIQSTVAIRNVA